MKVVHPYLFFIIDYPFLVSKIRMIVLWLKMHLWYLYDVVWGVFGNTCNLLFAWKNKFLGVFQWFWCTDVKNKKIILMSFQLKSSFEKHYEPHYQTHIELDSMGMTLVKGHWGKSSGGIKVSFLSHSIFKCVLKHNHSNSNDVKHFHCSEFTDSVLYRRCIFISFLANLQWN